MAVLLSKGALALFAFTAFAPSATGPLAASASDIEIESERQHRLRGQGAKDSIQVDSVRRLGSRIDVWEPHGWWGEECRQERLEVHSDEQVYVDVVDLCLSQDVTTGFLLGGDSPSVDLRPKRALSDQIGCRFQALVDGDY